MSSHPPVPPVPKRQQTPNARSTLLSDEETQTLEKLVGNKVSILGAAVVQVYSTEAPNHNAWNRLHCGVATVSKDNYRKSYYIQVYDIVNGERLFEQELYTNFQYHESLPFFHQFQGDNAMIGLSFADETEAKAFFASYRERQIAKQRKKEEKRRQHNRQNELQQQSVLQPQKTNSTGGNFTVANNNKHGSNRGRRAKVRKEDIGAPTEFRHITHVGFDPDNGFAQFTEDEALKRFLEMVGVDQNTVDRGTQEFIYDFIDKNGGIELARKETLQNYSGPMPSRTPAPPPANNNNNNNNIGYGDQKPLPPAQPKPAPPSLPARNAPPPPPRTITHHPPAPPPPNAQPPSKGPSSLRAPPPPPAGHKNSAAPPPPPPPASRTPAPPPPPPPPPPPSGIPPPPAGVPPPPAGGPPPASDTRSQLFDQIKSGKELKKVEPVERAPPTDSRSQLMNAIRHGVQLKPVENEGSGSGEVGGPPLGGLAGALAQALQSRAKGIQDLSDEEDDSEDEDDDEWEED